MCTRASVPKAAPAPAAVPPPAPLSQLTVAPAENPETNRKRTGRSSLRIDLADSTSVRSGLNIPQG